MSDPKDKLALMKEILSLCVVLIGFITALLSSGAFVAMKNVKIDPTVFFIVLAIVIFVIQLLLRIFLGEEKYIAARKKVISTARDFAIGIIIIAVFYFGGKYAWEAWNEPAKPEERKSADRASGKTDDKASASQKKPASESTPNKADSRKDSRPDTKADSTADAKPDSKDSKNDHKPEAKTDKKPDKKTASVKKHNRDEQADDAKTQKDKKPLKTSTAAADKPAVDDKPSPAGKQVNSGISMPDEKTDARADKAAHEENTVTVEVKRPAVKITVNMNSGEAEIVKTTASGRKEITTTPKIVEPSTGKVALSVSKPDEKTVAVEISKAPPQPQVIQQPPVDAKTAEVENVVINVAPPKAEEKKPEEKQPPAAAQPPAEAEKSSVEVEIPKTTEEDPEIVIDDESKSDTTSAFIKIETPSSRFAEKSDDKTLVVKKEIEPSSIKKAGEKIVEGGADLLGKAGRGIKRNIDKLKNIGK